MNYNLFLSFVYTFVLFCAGTASAACIQEISKTEIAKNDSTFELEIYVNEDFRDGEYMKIALNPGTVDEKIIYNGKIKKPSDDYHYRLTFKIQLKKDEFNILAVTTGRNMKTRASIGIKVNKGNYCELGICKWPTESDILLMISDSPGIFE